MRPRRTFRLFGSTLPVHKFRLSRSAVSLCLTTAMLLPSALLPSGRAAGCDAAAVGPVKCAGCNHCEVATEKDYCGCCAANGKKPDLGAKKHSCCGGDEQQTAEVDVSSLADGCRCARAERSETPAEHRLPVEQPTRLSQISADKPLPSSLPPKLATCRAFCDLPGLHASRGAQRWLGVWLL